MYMGRTDRNRWLCARTVAVLLLSALVHTGCSTTVEIPESYRTEKPPIRSVALSVAQFTPGVDTAFAVEGKPAGVASGAGQGALTCLELLDPHDRSGLSVFAALVCMPIAAMIGGSVGAARAETLNKVLVSRDKLQAGLAELRLQQALSSRSAAYLESAGFTTLPLPDDLGPTGPEQLPSYSSVSGVDAVLELSIVDITAGGSGQTPLPLYLGVTVKARLIALGSDRSVGQVRLFGRTPQRPLIAWLANKQALLVHDLDLVIGDLAVRAADELLLLWHPPAPMPERRPVPAYALEPHAPPARTGLDPRGAFLDRYRGGYGGTQFTQVDNSLPTLEWEAFLRPWDAGGRDAALFSDVRYDLRIYDALAEDVVFTAGRLIYERNGLREPWHRLETALTYCGRYFWTLRARFSLQGAPRVTEWSGAYATIGGDVHPWLTRRGETAAWYEKHFVERQFYLPFRVVRPGASCSD